MLADAVRRVRVISTSTPENLRAEIERLTALPELAPAELRYPSPPDLSELRAMLTRLAQELEQGDEIEKLYAGRARELELEAAVCEAKPGPARHAAARARYARRDIFDDEADALAERWLQEPTPASSPERSIRSDDDRDPRSLLRRFREEIGARRLPVRLLMTKNLASLAAAGDGFVQIIAGRDLSVADVERTVHHELEGHVQPLLRAERQVLSIFWIGTAHGSDDQEGRALVLEEQRGFLDFGRRRELSLRHVAARSVARGADFVSVARDLEARGADRADALRVTARVQRGGGLAREAVYLPAFLRVGALVKRYPELDRALAHGKVGAPAAAVLARHVEA